MNGTKHLELIWGSYASGILGRCLFFVLGHGYDSIRNGRVVICGFMLVLY